MRTMPHPSPVVNGQAAQTRKRATPATGGGLLLAIRPGQPLTIRCMGLTESEGIASQYLAERLRPQLDALDQAARRLAVGR